jgi:hypothetical protein
MKIYLELLIIGILFLMFFLWAIWKNITDFLYKWRYKKQNERREQRKDEGRSEEERGTKLDGGEPILESTSDSIPRPSQLERRELLPTTNPDVVRKDSNGSGKSSFITRIRRRKK